MGGLSSPQYSVNVLVKGATLNELSSTTLQVFSRFDKYCTKVNYEKVKCITTETTFLGHEIREGKLSLEGFLYQKLQELEKIDFIRGLERIIGIISYSRQCVKDAEKFWAHYTKTGKLPNLEEFQKLGRKV